MLGAVCTMLTWLFVGVSHDDEFRESFLFLKHRPTFQLKFHTPIGMSDMKLNDLSFRGQMEELAYQEFVVKRRIRNDGSNIIFELAPFALIQLPLTFFSVGFLKMKCDFVFNVWKLFLHWFICFLPTAVLTMIILHAYNTFSNMLYGLVIITVNWMILILLIPGFFRTRKIEFMNHPPGA